MITAHIKFSDGRTVTSSELEDIAAAVADPRAVFWLDMVKPADEEYAILDEVFGFHPLAIEDTINYQQRPKIESYNHVGDVHKQGYFYMVFHGPEVETFREKLRTKELDMFVSERYLVTVHEEPFKPISELLAKGRIDARMVLDPGIDLLIHNILDHLVDQYLPILDYLRESLDELEDQAVSNPTPDLLHVIATRKRELLDLRRIIGPQREVVAQLTRGEVPFIRESTRIYFRDVQDHLIRVVETVELYRDLVLGARDLYLSSINNHLNQIMKTLTMISVVAMPLTVITSFFGMNFDSTIPYFNGRWVFAAALAVMIALPVALAMLFKYKRWI